MTLPIVLHYTVLVFLGVQSKQASLVPSYLTQSLHSTKTPYEISRSLFTDFAVNVGIAPIATYYVVNEHGERSSSSDKALHPIFPKQCFAKQLSLVLRHGTRYPSPSDMKRIAKFHGEKLQHMNVADQYSSLKSWNNYFRKEMARTLAVNGAQENIEIATRYVKLLPELFRTSMAFNRFEIMSSNRQRTLASAEAFAIGLSKALDMDKHTITSNISQRDDLLRFFERCSRFIYEVDENEDEIMMEFNKFKHGPEMKEVTKSVSQRLSADADPHLISTDNLRTIWILCGFERALKEPGYVSPWCGLVTREESQVLEYAFDLKAYWKKSYGHAINYEQSCPLLADIVNNMREVSESDSSPRVSLYFGHAETINPIHALLGLFHDDTPLYASNYRLHKLTRKFRLGLTSAFTSNLGFVMYSCKEGPQSTSPNWPQQLDTTMVQLLHNEHPIPFPFTDKVAISYEEFERHYYQQINHCNFDEICNNEAETEAAADHVEL